mmetsp:Transcript_3613/g.5388  ORF Transcript_3613/g.5388 Transcript_3613/m.5388 type:complete len:252 (-) Transcript_3613:22-777(-)|eukprot:CAMPEP_0201546982 /NCGR_PEP_ID=MMETSP0173_2-20130828/3378_1 /ASSEMBLY_ACC=CAM_ASM_000268 /TAXON_ID=218659 /ORGANISM="Vexillifera sp., Strain DIVA3 564/2" /LENGTH=251 /DNA_ID=CAMNT_0047955851 /DNA_START=51 /DNA_END=806 /DNA_ORIENTATION=+
MTSQVSSKSLQERLDTALPPAGSSSSSASSASSSIVPTKQEKKTDGLVKGQVIRSRRVYVGNLNYRTHWQQLKDHFKQVGFVVHAKILKDGPNGRSKGCGIVEFETPELAAKAIRTLHNTELDRRLIFVREDREDFEVGRARVQQRGRGRGGASRNKEPSVQYSPYAGSKDTRTTHNKLVINNIGDASWREIKDFLNQKIGQVEHVDVYQDSQGRYATASFRNASSANRAFNECQGFKLFGRQLKMSITDG